MTIEQVADELYALRPDGFIAARDAAVRQARSAGDAPLAAAVAALRKPTAGAWLANLLAREHRPQVSELVDLGAALREAQGSLDAGSLRELSAKRQQVVNGLVRLARRTAVAAGQPAGEGAARELESTLVAALSDPDAAQALLSARLTTALEYAGLGFGTAAAAGPAEPKPRVAKQPAESAASARADLVDEAERALAAARLAEADAQENCRIAQDAATEARDRAKAATAGAAAAADALEAATVRAQSTQDELRDAKAAAEEARKQLADAERDRTQARQAVGRARKDLDRVSKRSRGPG